MTEDLENQLRRALRPVEAPAGLAERIVQALPKRPEPATVTVLARREKPRRFMHRFGLPGALAASLVGAVALGMLAARHQDTVLAQQDQAEGLAAKAALMDALRVTSRKLDVAYQAVNSPPPAGHPEDRS